MPARYLLGIDLGTTNSALAYIDSSEHPRKLRDFPIPQLVGPGDTAARKTLGSLHHSVGEHELPPGATRLPWTPKDAPAPDFVIGELARAQALSVPGRVVASAKSWLCHPRVDRLANILPWGAGPDVPRLSPVEASARYLRHMLDAFRSEVGLPMGPPTSPDAGIPDIEVVLTVPASFDEVARELTVEAARRAGLRMGQLTLLEEPQAAFYHWLSEHARLGEEVEGGDVLFVCDIGGGTTDFTLIEVQRGQKRKIHFNRTAVGDHVLLGGDNMDLSLARRVELAANSKLSPQLFASLVQSCRTAKERLLDVDPPERSSVYVAGRGSKLIGGGIRGELLRSEVETTLLDGFFPMVSKDSEPQRSRQALQEFGLPYAADPAVTRHIAAFLRQNRATPTAVLFNGGVLRASSIRGRILDVLTALSGQRPRLLTNQDPDLAVARGAAYYGLARRGEGLRISGGVARAYYIEVEAQKSATNPDATALLCLVPRGLEEGAEVTLPERRLALLTNRPVRFRLFSSAQRAGDQPGDLILNRDKDDAGELFELPPLYTVLRHPKSSQERMLSVTLAARLTEIGTLELWAVAAPEPGAGLDPSAKPEPPLRFRLQFDLRASEGAAEVSTDERRRGDAPAVAVTKDGASSSTSVAAVSTDAAQPVAVGAEAGLIAAAAEHIAAVFDGNAPAQGLSRALSAVLGPKDGWSTATLRALWEVLKQHREKRTRSAAHEARWLNLAGYCLRPGFGYALDDWRVREAWRIWNAGLSHDRDDPCKLEWWILWRRIAGGLTRTQQDEIWKRAAPLLLPQLRRPDKKPPSPQEAAEIWRTLGACERLEVKKKIELGDALLALLDKRLSEPFLWSLGRIGARLLLYGSHDAAVPPRIVEKWVAALLKLATQRPGGFGDKAPDKSAERSAERSTDRGDRDGSPLSLAQTLAELSRLTGDRARDLAEPLRQRLASTLKELLSYEPLEEAERLAKVVLEVVPREEREERFAFGDTLPTGLRLVGPADSEPAAE